MNCRHCQTELKHVFCDLKTCPPSNAMVRSDGLNQKETYFPLKIFTCNKCWLVQVDEVEKAADIFNEEYTYFSSFSQSWLRHAKGYVEYMISRFGFDENSLILEIASNDGYLLQYFHQKGIPVLGVEPSANTAREAEKKGIKSIIDFFGSRLANSDALSTKADLIIGNNVLAHVPDINDFVRGVKIALSPIGINTFEFPHLCQMIKNNQFDTIYHEHFSYLSLTTVKSIFNANGLEIFDVQELPTHGGSLRIFVKHKENNLLNIEKSVDKFLNSEKSLGIDNIEYYESFQGKVNSIKYDFIEFLIGQKKKNKKIIGYGAAAKGNTLLNYCGIKGNDLIDFVVDASPHKQNKYLPGSRIPVLGIDSIIENKPDLIIIFPWNLKEEISKQLAYTKAWNAKFVIAIPQLLVFD